MRPPAPALAVLLAALLSGAARAVEPPQTAAAVSRIVVRMLESAHYSRKTVDTRSSAEFLKAYLEGYDYSHLFFSKADVSVFEAAYGQGLAERVRAGDTAAAYAVFDRFMERLAERRAAVGALVASSMTFTAEEWMPLDWHDQPWAATEAELKDRWRQSLKYELLHARLDGQTEAEAAKTVLSRYDSLSDNYKQFDGGDVLQAYLSSLCRTFDPHTDYFAPTGEDNFNISMRLALFGIGAQLRFENGYTRVMALVPGGPAEKDQKLKPNDKIEAVAQGDAGEFTDVVGMKIDKVVQLIRGPKDTVVRLRVIPADSSDPSARVVIRLVRDEIKLRDQEAKAKAVTRRGRTFGVIDLPSFYADMRGGPDAKSTSKDVKTLLDALRRKDIEGLLLDLRRNGGGSLNEAVALTGLLAGKGPVVQVRDAEGEVNVLEADGRLPPYAGPLVVLTSRGSASASEILAAALQDAGRAVVVGSTSTFGKGTVQSVLSLEPYLPMSLGRQKAGSVHLTVQKFYRVSGGSTQNRGVIPDIRLPSIEDEMDVAESSLPNALPYDEIKPAPRSSRGDVGPRLPALRRASQARVDASPEWAYVREDIAAYRRREAEKKVSLNEARNRAEKAEDDARAEQRAQARAARGPSKDKVLEITLEDLDGKPPKEPEPPAKSTGTAEGKGKPPKPPAPDVALEESLDVLADLAGPAGSVSR